MPTNDSRDTPDTRGRAAGLRGLIALNATLLLVLAVVTFGATASAQRGGRSDYTMVAGGVNGAESSAVYIVDVNKQELMAVTYDGATKTLSGIGYRNLAHDAARVQRARGGN